MRKLPNSNLYITGAGHDINGNRIVKLRFLELSGFSIQTGRSLRITEYAIRGKKTARDLHEISDEDMYSISKEICSYIEQFGSKKQKETLKIDNPWQ